MNYSISIPFPVHEKAIKHLIRNDGQEDLCFGLWYPSFGVTRTSALIKELILPLQHERNIHGNASFLPNYFERALSLAIEKNAGLSFMHSHPYPGWHDMSKDDILAELRIAAAVKGATNLPLVGLTVGTDSSWSARFWEKTYPRVYERFWCESVRIIGNGLTITYADHLLPKPAFKEELRRTISSWGKKKQADLARLKVGIIGAGSVGAIIAETVARMGIENIKIIDFDNIEHVNLDRTLHATKQDVLEGKSKVEILANILPNSATAENFIVKPINYSVVEEYGFREALDCDVLFSCVDRPWPRSVLNFIAYAHLIPVVDGGITVKISNKRLLKGADWKAHIAGPQRKCLECLKQYDPGLVSIEREGKLDDPMYIESLPDEHPVKRNENVFAFSLSAASLQVLQFLSLVIQPLGLSNIGEQNYHFVIGDMDVKENGKCNINCPYKELIALGDRTTFVVTGKHEKAEKARYERMQKKFKKRRTILHWLKGR